MPFSVTISLYKNDNPGNFKIALNSIINQTMPPDEIILTIDGPISENLNKIVKLYENKVYTLKVIRLPENMGQGIAHKIGVENCSHELVAIMDSDDIAASDRFEKQLKIFDENPNIDILGGSIYEFIGDIENVVSARTVPLDDIKIKAYLRKRCPFNQQTVMFKKESVIKSGNYQTWHFDEDYYLWCRMLLTGCIFKNIPDVLVHVRVGKDMYKRRGGWKYFKSEAKLQKFMLDNKITNFSEYMLNVFMRFIAQVLMTSTIRGIIFRIFFRKSIITKL
jgi:glycosyltransferase involved in cell wall biosynthesis